MSEKELTDEEIEYFLPRKRRLQEAAIDCMNIAEKFKNPDLAYPACVDCLVDTGKDPKEIPSILEKEYGLEKKAPVWRG